MMVDTRGTGEAPVPEDGRAAIEVEDLVVSYGRKRAVDGLSLTVPVGSVYGFLGPNGAGKTTTIKTLLGFRGPDGGNARVLGYDVVRESGSAGACGVRQRGQQPLRVHDRTQVVRILPGC